MHCHEAILLLSPRVLLLLLLQSLLCCSAYMSSQAHLFRLTRWFRRMSQRRRNSVVRLYVRQNWKALVAVMAYSASSLQRADASKDGRQAWVAAQAMYVETASIASMGTQKQHHKFKVLKRH